MKAIKESHNPRNHKIYKNVTTLFVLEIKQSHNSGVGRERGWSKFNPTLFTVIIH